MLRHFQELPSATKKLASTDIPRSVLPDLVTLGERMHQESKIRSIAFVPPLIVTGNPNHPKIRLLTRRALRPPPATTSPPPTASASPAADPVAGTPGRRPRRGPPPPRWTSTAAAAPADAR